MSGTNAKILSPCIGRKAIIVEVRKLGGQNLPPTFEFQIIYNFSMILENDSSKEIILENEVHNILVFFIKS